MVPQHFTLEWSATGCTKFTSQHYFKQRKTASLGDTEYQLLKEVFLWLPGITFY